MEYAVKIPVTVNIAIRVGGADNEGQAIDAAFRELPKILGKITPPHEPRTVDYEHVTVGMLLDGSPMECCEHSVLVGCLKEPVRDIYPDKVP